MSDSEFVKKRSRRQPALASSTNADSVAPPPEAGAPDGTASDEVVSDGVTWRDSIKKSKNSMSYKLLMGVVIVLGALIVIAIILLVVGLAMRFTGHSAGTAQSAAITRFYLPPGSKILTMQITNDRLVLGVRTGADSEVDIFDTQTGRLVAQIKPKSK